MRTTKILVLTLVLFLVAVQLQAQDKSPKKKFHHVLMLQWKDSLDVSAKEEVLRLFRELPAKIKGFEKVDIVDLTMSTGKFDTVVIQVFDSEEAYKGYEVHPDHLRISKIGPPLLSGFGAFDYWK